MLLGPYTFTGFEQYYDPYPDKLGASPRTSTGLKQSSYCISILKSLGVTQLAGSSTAYSGLKRIAPTQ